MVGAQACPERYDVKQALADALEKRGYDKLTPVQEAVTAPELTEADLLVSAQTGSGKTVGFGLALAPTLLGEADRFDAAGIPLALIIAVMIPLIWLIVLPFRIAVAVIGGMLSLVPTQA